MSSPPQPPATSSPDGQHPIAQQIAALRARKQQNVSPSLAASVSPVQPKNTRLAWTGFKGKTLWDWLDFLVKLLGALAIPLVVVLASNALTAQQQRAADVQHQNEQAITKDQQQEATLKAYLDDMTGLLLNNRLRDSRPDNEVRNVARIKTLTAVRQLNGPRKGLLLQFLFEAGLLNKNKTVVLLQRADLSGVNLSADLSGADLSGANLSGADLSGANLSGADLTEVNLTEAYLSEGADLSEANLSRAVLTRADLSGINLTGVNLTGAYLSEANLTGANLTRADLFEADLSGADLTIARIANAQLITASSLQGTILPDGSMHP
jgi:uncharacterized protein YjbI with pentapeptide repeats